MKLLKSIRDLFHLWEYSNTSELRVCTVCGRVEEYEYGYDFGDSGHRLVTRGDPGKHSLSNLLKQ